MADNAPLFSNHIHRFIAVVSHPVLVWLILGVSLALTAVAYYTAKENVYQRANDRFMFYAETITQNIEKRMNYYQHILRGGVGLFQASEDVSRSEWFSYVQALELQDRLFGTQAIGVSVPISSEKLKIHEAQIQSQGFPEYEVFPKDERAFYTAISFVEPFDWRNQRVFGYDMYSEPKMRSAMALARTSNRPVLSVMVELEHEIGEDTQKGLFLYLPIFKQNNFMGWVYAAFRPEDLISSALREHDSNVNFQIFNGSEKRDESLLFDSNSNGELKASNPLFYMTKSVEIFGQEWIFYFSEPEDLRLLGFDQSQPVMVLIAGLIIDLLLIYVIVCLFLVNRHAKNLSKRIETEFQANQESLAWQTRLVEDKEREANVFFEMAPEAFMVVNKAGEIVKANKHAHELFGFRHNEMLGETVESLIPKNMAHHHAEQRKAFQASKQARLMGGDRKLLGMKADGSCFPVSVNLTPVDLHGESHTVAAIHDVSIQKNIEDTLAQAKENAESASRSKSEFLANMSHEIRTPLNAVLGSAQLMERTNPDANQKKYIGMVKSSGEALLGVINDILDFSKIEAGCMELNCISFNLDDVVTRVAAMMSVNIGEKLVEPVIDVNHTVPRQLVGDPLRLQQILINLVANAIKFTSSGFVVLKVYTTKKAAGNNTGVDIRFEVKDSGLGMDEEQQSRLFKAFSQADASITREYGGTGLGLAISNRIAGLMGSHIEVRSQRDAGSQFSLTIPFALSLGAQYKTKFESVPPKHVLWLDRSRITVNAVENIFKSVSWTFHACLNTGELDGLVDKKFDFIFVDEGFYEDAESAISRLKKRGSFEEAAFVAVFSNSFRSTNLSGTGESQFAGAIVKPLVRSNVSEAIEEAHVKAFGFSLFDNRIESLSKSNKLEGMRILLVEDNYLNQGIAVSILEDFGVDYIDVVNNGLAAFVSVQEAQDTQGVYDLILTDIQMPVMDGISATKKIRSELKSDIPIVAMTAGVQASEQQSYTEAGMNGFVAKPIDEKELFKVVSHYYHLNMAERAPSIKKNTVDPTKNISVFDLERIETLINDNADRKEKVIFGLNSILKEMPERISEGRKAIHCNDIDHAKFIFHGVKGVVANFGANRLAETLLMFETYLSSVHVEDGIIAKNIEMVCSDFDEFRLSVESWLGASLDVSPTKDTGVVSISKPLPEGVMASLEEALKLQDISAIEQSADKLEVIGEEGKQVAEKIRRLLNEFDTQGIQDVIEILNRAKN